MNDYVVVNDTTCYAEPGSIKFYVDPCCNIAQTWADYCAPRSVSRRVYGANELLLAESCSHVPCSTAVATALAAATTRIGSSSCNAESYSNLAEILDPLGNGQGQQGGPCAAVFEFGSDVVRCGKLDPFFFFF